MLKQLFDEIDIHKDKAKVVPVRILKDLQQEMTTLSMNEKLNDFQKYLIHKMFSYSEPKLDFEIRSVIIVATPCLNGRITFHYNGIKHTVILPAGYSDYSSVRVRIFEYINNILSKNNLHTALAGELPDKLLAVKSGLAQYGSNNLCYVDGMGSYTSFVALFSDIEAPYYKSHENRLMNSCMTCQECRRHCPTGAISKERVLIDNEKCLTYMNEAGAERSFPEWLPPNIHNSLIGCTLCQQVCPHNNQYVQQIVDVAEFNEEETKLLLNYIPEEQLPDELKIKLSEIELLGYRGALSRNLRVLLNP